VCAPASSAHRKTWIDSCNGVVLPAPGDERVGGVDGADLDLQMEAGAGLATDRRNHLEEEAGKVLQGPPYSSVRSLIAELRNWVNR
jgi:hypothetical protein